MRGTIVGVCGPMGAGKSTLVGSLATALGFTPRLERVDDNPFFRRYTEDQSRWSFWSQMAFILGAVNEASFACGEEGTVLERPAEEMYGVFVRELTRRGAMSEEESRLLAETLAASERVAPTPDLLVVLHADARTLHERIRVRADIGDNSYRLEDIQDWVDAFASWRESLEPGRVIDRDVNKVDLRAPDELRRLAAEIEERLSQGLRADDRT